LRLGGLETSSRKKKTILRTIRLTEEIDDMLEKDAQEQNLSANALISKIMTRYVEWDRNVEKTSFTIISSHLFKALIDEVSEEKLDEIGRTLVYQAVKELAMVEFGKTDFDTLLNTVFLLGKYDTSLRLSAPSSSENRVDSQYIMTMRHDWGPKGSVLLRGFFDNIVRSELGKQPTISFTDDVITVSFPRLSKMHP
jgi:hypothetical protein